MNKILMVSMFFPPTFGGASVQSLRLAKELIKQGCQVEFLSDNATKPTIYNDQYDGVVVTRLKTYSENLHSKIRELIFSIKLIKFLLFRPDLKIVHFHAIRGLELLTFPIIRLMGKKVILKLTLVGVDDPMAFKSRKLLSPFFMWGLRSANHMIAISEELQQRSYQAGFDDQVVKKIFNGFDEENFFIPDPELKKSLREKLAIPATAPVFLSVGKVEHRKGYDLLLQAFADIQKSMPEAKLVIVGPDNVESNSYYVSLSAFIAKQQLKNIHFVGRQYNVHEFTKAADYFLFCSRQEGFGTVMIEAMACGLPTAAMNIQGVTEDIITDHRIGTINYSHNPAEFAQQTLNLIQTAKQADIQAAVKALSDKFSISNIAKSYIHLYRQLSDHQQ
ncbi:glycosyltransferase family 4 protein [Methylophilus sp. Q8]|uniref:glycosyltransferase family 4 protein n=1 Tax=Methylophilus sp. Q8 TaxID=1506586 RepID=UPI000648ED16|nr:glycosyltransferase family 4 protein [Methylophilus sp. Q8]